MKQARIENRDSKIFLGVDGGQSHTEAVIADEGGRILGRGFGGASNHAEIPGGRERLQNAVLQSVAEALGSENRDSKIATRFAAAHFGMTGGADYKEEIIGELINAEILKIGHDAPTALAGGTAGKCGIVVISGTGSVIYGENESGEAVQAGGLGYLFSDEGSGFWLATQTIRLAIKEQDGVIEKAGLEKLVTEFFRVKRIRDLTTLFYNGKISRDEIAAFARVAHEAAAAGNESLRTQIRDGTKYLAENVKSVAKRLQFSEEFAVVAVGGMFRGNLMKAFFVEELKKYAKHAKFTEPQFSPAIGALLLAYREFGIKISADLLKNLANSNS